jgi:arylsulfatase
MLPHIVGEHVAAPPRTIYWQHENHAAVREGDWKLVTSNDRDSTAWELYHLAEDRSETNDVSRENPEVVARLRTNWNRWAAEANVFPYPEQRGAATPVPWPPK